MTWGRMLPALVVALVVGFAPTVWAQGTISGSAHDFSGTGWTGIAADPGDDATEGEICIVCHTPHSADVTNNLPLWNHERSTVTWSTFYSSATLNASPGNPQGVSRLCLSCHDGSINVDAFGGTTPGTVNISVFGADRVIGDQATGDLSAEHPISFDYNSAQSADGGLYVSSTVTTLPGAPTIAEGMLVGGQMECSSCHDVHNNGDATANNLLHVNNADSALCLTCHVK